MPWEYPIPQHIITYQAQLAQWGPEDDNGKPIDAKMGSNV